MKITQSQPRIRDLVESEAAIVGHRQARASVARQLKSKLDSAENSEDAYLALSVRDLFEAFIGPADEHTILAYQQRASLGAVFSESEMVSSAFHVLTGNIIQRAILKGFNTTDGLIADSLVDTFTSKIKEETLSGLQAIEKPQDVSENQVYPWVGFDEKSVKAPEPGKRGFLTGLTREMILFDQTGRLQQNSQAIGRSMAYDREEQILKAVTDHAGFKRYYPKNNSGDYANEALYRASGAEDTSTWFKRFITTITNALVDFTSLTAAMENFAARTDEQGRNILVLPKVMVVPFALKQEGLEALGYTQGRTQPAASASTRQQIGPNVIGQVLGLTPKLLTTPILDGFATDATGTGVPNTTTWYIGDPKETFKEQVHWATQVQQGPSGDGQSFDRDLVLKWKATRKSNVTVATDAYWLRCTA